jgi:hypothetical protein
MFMTKGVSPIILEFLKVPLYEGRLVALPKNRLAHETFLE